MLSVYRMLSSHVRDRVQQPQVGLASGELLPGLGGGRDQRALQQLGSGRLPVQQVPGEHGPVCGSSVRSDRLDGDPQASGAEARNDGRRVNGVEAAAELAADGCRRHDDIRAERIGRPRPQQKQAALGDLVRLER